MKKISTLNMKSDKCEKQLYAKCEQVLVSSMTSQTVNLANLVDLVSFFRHFWDIGGGVNISMDTNPGQCHYLQRKCTILIREQQGKAF